MKHGISHLKRDVSHLKYGKVNWKNDVSIRLWDVSSLEYHVLIKLWDAAKTEIYLTAGDEMIIDYPAKNRYIVAIKIRLKTQDYRLKM